MSDKTAYALNLVRNALSKYTDTPLDQILPDTKLADIQIDSLTLAELLFELEDQLGVTMAEPPSLPQSVADLLTLVDPYLPEQALAEGLKSAA